MRWLTIALITGMACDATALRLVDQDDYFVALIGLVQAGYQIEAPAGESVSDRPYIGVARAGVRAERKRWGGGFVHFAGESGTVKLLDAIAYIRPLAQLELRAGYFKVPLSFDFLIGAHATPFVNRSLLIDISAKRLPGLELVGNKRLGPVDASLQLGWFARGDLSDPGSMLSVRLKLGLPADLTFHLAYLDEVRTPDAAAGADLDRRVDVALQYVSGPLTARVEGLIAPGHNDTSMPFGVYGEVLYAIDVGHGMAVEPGLHYSALRTGGDIAHKGTAGATWYLFGEHLQMTLNYELHTRGGDPSHGGYLQLQAGM